MLYGLNFYREFGKERELFMVEGYMDCISVSSFGFPNVVASFGTGLTTEQVRLLRRFADTVYFAYDGDAAGPAPPSAGWILPSARAWPCAC
ncbi:MAG: toprim domain-containing protein [Christensenellales bacterium]